VVTIAVQECLRAMSILFNEREVAEITQMYAQVEWVLDTLFFMYQAQNSAIGHFAQEKGITHLPLAEIEERWISDPDGEDRFYSEFRERNPREYDEVKRNFDFCVFMLFQMLWQCDPTHLYLLSLHIGHEIRVEDLSKGRDNPENLEAIAFRHMRERLRPFLEATVQ